MRYINLVFLLAILWSCQTSDSTRAVQVQRPYSPWVMRSVLDEQPRMLSIALHENMWVAYNTENCALYKVWNGRVDFEGAVFNTAHGPQPISLGDAYIVNVFDQPWRISRDKGEMATTAHYVGHRRSDDRVELIYDLYSDDLPPVRVYEHVEYVESPLGLGGITRNFTTERVPDGYEVILQTNINSVASWKNVRTNGTLVPYEKELKEFEGKQLIEMEGHLQLINNDETNFTLFFASEPTIPNTLEEAAEMEEELPFGYRLITQSDCKICHNVNVPTIGPSYVEVAERYPNNEQSVATLVQKVINGGGGIWGAQIMSPHPDLPETDVQAMVQWILDLDEDEGTQQSSSASASKMQPISVDSIELGPGALTEIHQFGSTPNAIPARPTRLPSFGGVMPNFDNLYNFDFTDLGNDFGLYSEGYLSIEEAGTYTFRIWSDDGSKLWMNDELVIDNDGLHGVKSEEVMLSLEEGYYAFRLEFYQGGGDKFLSFSYLPPSAGEFMVVPISMFWHDLAKRDRISSLTLSMSIDNSTPGDKRALEEVHPAYDLAQARPYDFLPKVGGMDFFDDGRLAICTWDPAGSVYILENVHAPNPNDIKVTLIADGLAEPLGLKIVDNAIYVLQKQELTKLVDIDGDLLVDEYLNVSNAWKTSGNFHEFAFGLEYKDGFFYAALATAIDPGGASTRPQIEDRGKVAKISAETGEVEFLAHGLRTPNGIGFGIDGELFVTDNQGDWLPSSKVVHIQPGKWYGSRSVDFEETAGLTEQLPVVWLPQDEIGNSPGTPLFLPDGPYAGQMIHGDVTHGGVKRVFAERIDGQLQGAVFRFIQGLEAGVNRMAWGPDGALYIGGIGNPGNWSQAGKFWYGLQRLKYNSTPVFEMLAVRAMSDGVEIEFTEPLREGEGWDASLYDVEQWEYIPTENYGGPKENWEALRILSVNISEDRTRVFLQLAGMKENRVVYVHMNERLLSANDRPILSTEAWYTMNNIPTDRRGFRTQQTAFKRPNTLTAAETAAGWQLLFDGESITQFKRFNQDDLGTSWIVEDGAIKLDAKMGDDGRWHVDDRGDLITREQYENFELNLEWKISNCGNSGIMFGVQETPDFTETYLTGPEMQILDNACHPDARFPTHRAGDLYDMVECKYVTVKPAGEWNKVRLIKRDGQVEHWLNGVKVVEYAYGGRSWDRMVGKSKFADWEHFGKAQRGHIALQDHGDAQVFFRNVKILSFD